MKKVSDWKDHMDKTADTEEQLQDMLRSWLKPRRNFTVAGPTSRSATCYATTNGVGSTKCRRLRRGTRREQQVRREPLYKGRTASSRQLWQHAATMQLAAVLALLVVAAVDARIGDDPSPSGLGVRTCPSNEPDVVTCRRNALQSALSLLAGGLPSIGAKPIDPLTQIPPLILKADTPLLRLNFKLDDIVMIGHARSVLDDLQVDVENHTIHVVTHTPGALVMEGIYTLDEEVIKGIPVRGNGRFKLTMIDSTADVTYKGHPVTRRNGETYLQLDSAKTKYTYGKTSYKLTGLFGGFPPLEAAGNALINAIASPIVERDMLGPMEDWMEQVYKQQAQYVFDTVPYNKLFPESVKTITKNSFFFSFK
ncbi:putative beta-carotene-binding protein isoform X6 [Schistocerca serialis cubense]|uniref:putative beta-carotene-binding protein isoform X6 n=1 Tax=Schistocerca serialis cubense TaxID=2023355 RepID=UPI00214E20D6|nr:putative beta-carotene-binding protein isoform X6 [Schistocerca serialis cubense]